MSKFATKFIESVKGRQQFHQLVILPTDTDLLRVNLTEQKGQFDIYEESLESCYEKDCVRLISIMNAVANIRTLPQTQCKDVTPSGEAIKEYEAKPGDLRLHIIQIFAGKLVVLGGYKNRQKADFKKFRSLKGNLCNHI